MIGNSTHLERESGSNQRQGRHDETRRRRAMSARPGAPRRDSRSRPYLSSRMGRASRKNRRCGSPSLRRNMLNQMAPIHTWHAHGREGHVLDLRGCCFPSHLGELTAASRPACRVGSHAFCVLVQENIPIITHLADKDRSGRASQRLDAKTGVAERVVDGLEQDALLRVHDVRLGRWDLEKAMVEGTNTWLVV